MADNEVPPIVVNPTPTQDQVSSGIRSAVLVVGAVGAILGFVGKHDLAGLITYLQSAAFLPAAFAIATVGSFLWGQLKTRHRAKQLAIVAASPRVSNEVIRLTTDPDPTKPTDAAALAASFKQEN